MQSTTLIFYGEVLKGKLKSTLIDRNLNGVTFCHRGLDYDFRAFRAACLRVKHGFAIKKLKVPAEEIAALFKSGIA